MIGQSCNTLSLERFGQLLCALAGGCVNNPALAFMGADQPHQAVGFIASFWFRAERQVRAIEARDMQNRIIEIELL